LTGGFWVRDQGCQRSDISDQEAGRKVGSYQFSVGKEKDNAPTGSW
jgi:hypothetical protein